jgi:hypothetical protein
MSFAPRAVEVGRSSTGARPPDQASGRRRRSLSLADHYFYPYYWVNWVNWVNSVDEICTKPVQIGEFCEQNVTL